MHTPSVVLAFVLALAGLARSADPVPANAKATRPVAAWDVVPYQVFSRTFNAGVVAFHETGCKVQFTVTADGKDVPELAKTVENPTLNPQTNVWEFWLPLDPAKLPAGLIEVHAKVIPLEAGMITRDLVPLPLYANGNNSLDFGKPVWVDCANGKDTNDGSEAQPFQTLKAAVAKAAAGATIYLKAGKDYSADGLAGGFKRAYWTTITAAPGRGAR